MTLKTKHGAAWVDVADAHVLSGGSFRRVLTAYVKQGGVWKQVYTYVASVNTSVSATPSTTTPTAPSTAVTISGTVTPVSGAIPDGSFVELYDGGTKLLTTTTTSGAYSFSWTPTVVGAYSLTVKFVLSGVYQPSQVTVTTINASASTTATISVPGDTVVNIAGAVAGTVSSSTGETPSNGTVTIEKSTDNVNWSTAATTTTTSGSWSTTVTSATPNQMLYFRAVYSATGSFLSSASVSGTVFFMRPTPGTPALTPVVLTSVACRLSWSSTNATSYDVYKSGVKVLSAVTYTSHDFTGLSEDTSYPFYVIGKNENTTDGATTSVTKTYNTGHDVVTDTGSITGATWNAVETGSYRSSDGWTNLGTDLAQGYFSANPYTGIARFDTAAMRTYIDAYGTDQAGRYNHVTCTKLEVYASRKSGSGSSGSVPIGWYLSNTNPGSGTPVVAGGPDTSSPSGLAAGSAGWLQLPDETWGPLLVHGTWIDIAMYYNGSTNYSIYYGGSNFKVRMSLTWAWTVTAAVTPTWT